MEARAAPRGAVTQITVFMARIYIVHKSKFGTQETRSWSRTRSGFLNGIGTVHTTLRRHHIGFSRYGH